MNFPSHLVIKKTDCGYRAGLSRAIGKGTVVASFGKWYGSQMRYKPFKRAVAEAAQKAAELNANK